jgi:hypothetical protein
VLINWKEKLFAAAIHFAISLAIALLAAIVVFAVWYPFPYRDISGGRELFTLLVTVDVILGPLLTFAVFNRKKPRKTLTRDLIMIGLLQLAALVYGLWTVFVSRPVYLVFEYDRFRVVHAIEVDKLALPQAPESLQRLPMTGPVTIGLRAFKNSNEMADMTMAALSGLSLSARPQLWQPYAQSVPEVLKVAKPVTVLQTRFAAQAGQIDEVLRQAGRTAAQTSYVPLVGHKGFWTVFVDPATAQPVAYMPLDSF